MLAKLTCPRSPVASPGSAAEVGLLPMHHLLPRMELSRKVGAEETTIISGSANSSAGGKGGRCPGSEQNFAQASETVVG
jgi:hypothetical protein